MADGLPEGWERELEHKEEEWRLGLARCAAAHGTARGARRARGRRALARRAAADDGLRVRRAQARARAFAAARGGGGAVGRHLAAARAGRRVAAARRPGRGAACTSATTSSAACTGRGRSRARKPRRSAVEIQEYDEDRVLLDSAVKGSDGFFTTFFVSTWSRYVARWAARAGLTPNQVTFIALCIGLAAASRVRHRASAPDTSRAPCSCISRSSPTASTASSRATRAGSRSSAPGSTRSSTGRRSTSAFAGLAIGAAQPGGLGAGRRDADPPDPAPLVRLLLRRDRPPEHRGHAAAADRPGPDEAAARTRMKARETLEAKLGALRAAARGPRPAMRRSSPRRTATTSATSRRPAPHARSPVASSASGARSTGASRA